MIKFIVAECHICFGKVDLTKPTMTLSELLEQSFVIKHEALNKYCYDKPTFCCSKCNRPLSILTTEEVE